MQIINNPLLPDQNANPAAVNFLWRWGFDMRVVVEDRWTVLSDRHLLTLPPREGRAVVTQHSNFGTPVINQHSPAMGLSHVRSGQIDSNFSMDTSVVKLNPSLELPQSFVTTVKRTGLDVKFWVRVLHNPMRRCEHE